MVLIGIQNLSFFVSTLSKRECQWGIQKTEAREGAGLEGGGGVGLCCCCFSLMKFLGGITGSLCFNREMGKRDGFF